MDGMLAHLQQTKALLESVESQGSDAANKLRQLSEDFVFNLGLLADRDRELDACEDSLRRLKGELAERDARVSELQMILADKELDLDNLRAFHANQDHSHADALRRMRRDHEAVLEGYISSLQEKDRQLSELQTSSELQSKSYNEELVALKHSEKQYRELKWEYSDFKKQVTSTIADLKHELSKAHQQLELLEMNHESQRNIYLTDFNSKEKVFKNQIKTLQEEVSSLTETIIKHELFIKNQADLSRRNLDELQSAMEDKDATIEKLGHKLEKASEKLIKITASGESKLQKLRRQLAQSASAHEQAMTKLDSEALKRISSLKHEASQKEDRISSLEQNLEMCQRELESSMNEVSKLREIEMDLKEDFTAQKAAIERKAEDLIQRKQKEFESKMREAMRDQKSLAADVEQLRRENLEMEKRAERDRDHESLDFNQQNRIQELEDQNAHMREIIRQMRVDMENMIQQQNAAENQSSTMSSKFTRLVSEEAAIANEQLQKLAEIVEQKQQLIESLLRGAQHTMPTPAVAISSTQPQQQYLDTPELVTQNSQLVQETNQLKARVKEITAKFVETSADRMRLLDVCNSLRAELRQAVAGAAKAVAEAEVQSTSLFHRKYVGY
ncbi:hypothetical protein BC830DRAFT_1100417 [Chytriomyces sp. MP71]|nr:hypothetical protein BC830DRAFT_1100417 [Chytriomyces sp. MP71]